MRRIFVLTMAIVGVALVGYIAFSAGALRRSDAISQFTTPHFSAADLEGESQEPLAQVKSEGEQGLHGSVARNMVLSRSAIARASTLQRSPTEQAMLSNGFVNEAATRALKSKHFDRFLTQIEIEQNGLTDELTAAYRNELEKSLGSVAAPKQLDRLVCGTDLCIATIRSSSKDWYSAWSQSVQARSELSMNALTGNEVDLGGSGVEYRVLFSTSKGVRGFTGPPPHS